MILDIMLICIIVVYIIDLSGAPEHLFKPIIRKLLGIKPSQQISIGPLECSLCLTFWLGLGYLLFTGNFNLLGLCVVVIASFFSSTIKGIIFFIKELLENFIWNMNDKLNN